MNYSEDLVRRLGGDADEVAEELSNDDSNIRGLALGELIRRGKSAVPALLKLLKSDDANMRALAAEGLASIAEPSTAEDLAGLLKDSDPRVRAQAASGLAYMDDPRGIPGLIATINDNRDILHASLSLSSYKLAMLGPKALPAVAPLLNSEDEPTRWKALWIIQQITGPMPDAQSDPGFANMLNSYKPDGPEAERKEVAGKLIQWVAEHTRSKTGE
jgi:hypothetical protein